MDSISAIILGGALIIIMLGMGFSLTVDDFKRVILYPKAIFIGLANQLILLPLVGFGLASLFNLQADIAIGLMILAACPGGPTSNLISHLARGDVALSVSLTAVSSLITIITIPFVVNFALVHFLSQGQMIQLPILQTIAQIFIIVLIPVAIGMAVKHFRPAFADKMVKPVRTASALVLILVILGIIFKERENFVSYFEQAGFVAFLLNIITMGLGYYSARLFRLDNRQAASISIESGIQNGTLAISIAVVLLSSSAFAITPAVYSLIMFFTGGAVIYLGIRNNMREVRKRVEADS